MSKINKKEEKKIKIYEATLNLMEDRHDFLGIKVEDIAKKADVGKGTIYEYFKTKEQVISESIFYMLKQWIAVMENTLDKSRTFEDGFKKILMDLFEILEKKHHLLFTFLTLQDFHKGSLKEIEEAMSKRSEDIQRITLNLYEKIIQYALKDQVIYEKPDLYDGYFAVSSAIMYVMIYEDQRLSQEDILMTSSYSKERIVNKAYRIFIQLTQTS